jgi:urease accessory protein
VTLIAVEPGAGRPRLTLVGGALAPRVLSSDATGARVALVATTALLLGGDRVEVELRVGPGAWLEIVETAGTVAYDADGERSSWTVRAEVAAGGLLLWHGEPFVASKGANTVRDTTITMGPAATVCLRETIVLGRSGEQGGALRIRTRVRRGDTPLLVEDLDLSDRSGRRQPGIIGTANILDTVTWVGGPAPAAPMLEPGRRFDLADDAGAVVRVLRSGLAGSPAGTWWAAWSRRARDDYSAQRTAVSGSGPAAQRLPAPAAAARTPEPV